MNQHPSRNEVAYSQSLFLLPNMPEYFSAFIQTYATGIDLNYLYPDRRGFQSSVLFPKQRDHVWHPAWLVAFRVSLLSAKRDCKPSTVSKLGKGWVAEEAIAGNLLGLLYPDEVYAHPLLPKLGGRTIIEDISGKLWKSAS